MRVLTIPSQDGELTQIRSLCREGDLPGPEILSHTQLHLTLRELLETPPPYPEINSMTTNACLMGVVHPVVLFANVAPAQVQRAVKLARQQAIWPIFAVVTRQSIDFTLAILLEHLNQDRSHERQLLAQRQAAR